mmetsp:Transcript_88982/g.212417  ORF Transcript_88982/g.212417 Transcript_88982/m.212417 type:complete len:225 (-) Transcript_88982:814-1488(-)
MYSLMSKRIMASSMPKYASDRALHSSVLPTPVGPQKMKEAMGLLGFCRPALARRTAFAMAVTASSWPMTRLCSVSSRCTRRTDSSAETFSTGTLVQAETTDATSFSVTMGFDRAASLSSAFRGGSSTSSLASFSFPSSSATGGASRSSPLCFMTWYSLQFSSSSLFFSSAALLKSWSRTASSFSASTSRSSPRTSKASSGIAASCLSCTRAPVSSSKSMALSGR